jgi:nucleoside-diphosphate-sugar epimerase
MPAHPLCPESPLFVTGATAATGRALLEASATGAFPVLALSRRPPPAWAGTLPQVEWSRIDLESAGDLRPSSGSVLLSAGPLAALATWLERAQPDVGRLVALSSTSLHVKQRSVDASERTLVKTLAEAEDRVTAWCDSRRVPWTLLRPTLIVSARDGDALDWIARAGRRFGAVVLPAASLGRRQPVAARDVAHAMLAASGSADAAGQALDLPGGETLDYREMVRRVLAARAPEARLLIAPDTIYRTLARAARRHPALAALTPAVIARMAEDLVFDDAAAAQALGFRCGAFDPAV